MCISVHIWVLVSSSYIHANKVEINVDFVYKHILSQSLMELNNYGTLPLICTVIITVHSSALASLPQVSPSPSPASSTTCTYSCTTRNPNPTRTTEASRSLSTTRETTPWLTWGPTGRPWWRAGWRTFAWPSGRWGPFSPGPLWSSFGNWTKPFSRAWLIRREAFLFHFRLRTYAVLEIFGFVSGKFWKWDCLITRGCSIVRRLYLLEISDEKDCNYMPLLYRNVWFLYNLTEFVIQSWYPALGIDIRQVIIFHTTTAKH